jgi:hypothetical protein
MSENSYFYANSERDCWDRAVAAPISKRGARHLLSESGGYLTDENDVPIEVSEIKIVAVYLKTNEYESLLASCRTLEDLSDFNRAVVEEIDRRGIDAIVEPLSFVCMPTTLRFRAQNGGFVWIPILAFSVVDGPKDTRTGRTVDRMLAAIEGVAKNLSGIDTGK